MASSSKAQSIQSGRGVNGIQVLALTLAALLLVAVGWFAATFWAGTTGLSVSSQIAGKVSVASASGADICITPDTGGADRCGIAYQGRDDPALKVGDRVQVAVGNVKKDATTSIEVFVVVSVKP